MYPPESRCRTRAAEGCRTVTDMWNDFDNILELVIGFTVGVAALLILLGWIEDRLKRDPDQYPR
ncbi:hypothetical protein SAMN04489717_3363 [Actinopolymorpha singaporensis]|uniref:Uncharacterized protein n=1 Tax=Actinopolymorpha singaporensis TaxID=117157 RepID=A0A1H1TW24_9ACTN|nr:hypothetical protein SAMN04489717_3363 [Actinopolymorpha singaporensis]